MSGNKIHTFAKKVITHRGDTFLSKMYVPTPLREIDGHQYVLGVLWDDDKWYIMPAAYDVLDKIPDLGPYDDFDDALLHFKLMSEVSPR